MKTAKIDRTDFLVERGAWEKLCFCVAVVEVQILEVKMHTE